MTRAGVELSPVDLPTYDLPIEQPQVPQETFLERVAAAERATAEAGLDGLIVYADREHFANLSYLTGFDPRFEEALLLLVPGRAPVLLVGNEGVSYAKVVPPAIEVLLYQSLSLVSQDRSASPPLADILRGAGIGGDGATRIGIAGWKFFGPADTGRPAEWIDDAAEHRRPRRNAHHVAGTAHHVASLDRIDIVQ